MSVRTVVLWSATDDPAFLERYRSEHIPLVRALPGLTSVRVSPLRSRTHTLLAELEFPDLDTSKTAFGSEQGAALGEHTEALMRDFGVTTTVVVALESFEE